MNKTQVLKITQSQYNAIKALNLACGKEEAKSKRWPQAKWDEGIRKIFGNLVEIGNFRFEVVSDPEPVALTHIDIKVEVKDEKK